MSEYEQQVRRWGIKKLKQSREAHRRHQHLRTCPLKASTVRVRFTSIDIGFCETCSQHVPGAYISGTCKCGKGHYVTEEVLDMPLDELLRELMSA